jgi:ubiquinone/menaquinone biosynthesis C-methylase UbiE
MSEVPTAAALSMPACTITEAALARVRDGQGHTFAPLMRIDPARFAADTLDPRKALEQAAVLAPFVDLSGKSVLEIGSGCGVTHIVWRRAFNIDGWGVEPEGYGFDESAAVARELIAANGLDAARIVNARGESLPFPDGRFDIVYSSNVLEHTDDPARVLAEAVRVLKPGGIAQFVCPNYRSYFDGHYAALHPPIFSNAFFRWWIKWVYRRDPTFAATIRTEINPQWMRRRLADIARGHPVEVLGLGEDVFLRRMDEAAVGRWMGLGVVGRLVALTKALHLNRLAARVAIALGGWTPLVVTIRRR